ncbi:protein bric-a-brac 1 isoform X2 [Cephus cinctus]|uniref:Protein bric-a-brac 1 isoform X2 n=1 Tax=Cephus cinctus TaxID=211228 RepID=A0AAJ7BYM3_CEPCN|nr:protein bric-a-brac 1 isoform X2 [Cephus cinctus]
MLIIKMGSTSQLYSLSWGEFSTSLTSAVQLLRGHGELVDVTLAAGGRSFPAHKIVLSAASPFLLDLLKSTPCQHPVVMLAGIGADDLESLLEFVYRGEVSVEPAQLPSLLQAAHCLSIHGLTPPTILTENGEEIPISAIPSANEALTRDVLNSYLPVRRRKKRRKSSSSSGKWPKTNDHTNTENRPLDSQSQENRTADYDHKDSETTSQTEDMGDGNSKARSVSDQPATCPLCGALLRQSRNLRRHLELLHFGTGKPIKQGVRISGRRSSRSSDLLRSSSLCSNRVTPTNRIDHPHLRPSDSSDMQTVTPLSIASVVSSSASNMTIPGNLMVPGASILSGSNEQSVHPVGTIPSSSCTGSMGPPHNGIYSSDSTTSMLSCLLPPLPSLPSLSSPHDVFRHSEMLRAGVAYYDTSRQPSRHIQRTDVT